MAASQQSQLLSLPNNSCTIFACNNLISGVTLKWTWTSLQRTGMPPMGNLMGRHEVVRVHTFLTPRRDQGLKSLNFYHLSSTT